MSLIAVLHLDRDHTKTAEELDVLLHEDSELFIDVSIACLGAFLPPNTVDRYSAKTRPSAAKKICCGSRVLRRCHCESFVSKVLFLGGVLSWIGGSIL